MSGGKQSSSSQSNQEIWKPWADAMQPMLGQAEGMFDQGMDAINNPELQTNLNNWNNSLQSGAMDGWQQQMQGGNLAGYDISGALGNSMTNSMQNPTNEQQALNNAGSGQNYSDAYRQNFVNDAQTAQSSMMQGLDGRAAASGMSGGSRHGMATAAGMSDINSNMQSNLANVGYQDYTNNMNRQQQAGANADRNTMMQQQMMSGLLGQQNASQQGALANSGAMAGLGGLGYQAATSPFMSYSQMMQGMGPAPVLSESQSSGSSRQGGL